MRKIDKVLTTGKIEFSKKQLKESNLITVYMERKQCSREVAEKWYRDYQKNSKADKKDRSKKEKLIGNTKPLMTQQPGQYL
jgi:hypothetical protein